MITKGKILVIEDLEEWQVDLRQSLEQAGFYVEVVDDLESALSKIKKELFHFITIDMNLKRHNRIPEAFDGWDILKVVKQLQLNERTPTMIITAYPEDFLRLHIGQDVEELFLMDKGTFDRDEFIKIVEREINRKNLRFKDDHRDNH